jgi:hypothetical protein
VSSTSGELGFASLTPPTCWVGEFLALNGQIRAVIFPGAVGVWGQQGHAICHKSFC